MKTKNMIWAALSMTAALVMTACSNDDNTVETPAAPQAEVKTIPYSVTVGQGGDAATTRANVAEDLSTLKFVEGDQLYISSDSRTDLKGVLTLKDGEAGKTSDATFEGTISYTGDAPDAALAIKATLVSSSNVGVQIADGKVTGMSYPDGYLPNVQSAVALYSNLTGTSTYGSKSFTLTQQTAFLNFDITFIDGTTGGISLMCLVKNGGTNLCNKAVDISYVGEKVVAKFVLPVAKGTTLSGATVQMGDKAALIINDATLDGKVYNVKRTYAAPTLAQTMTTAGMTVKVKYNYSDEENYCLFSSVGDGTYTFQSGYGYAGGDDCAKDLVVEGGKLVFKQNFFDTIDDQWSNYGFSATFDTSNNSYIQFVGPWVQELHNPSFISVEVNSVPIALTKIITVADLVKENDQSWSVIINNNSDKIKEEGNYVVRISDNAKLQRNMWGDDWQYVDPHDNYQSMNTYKFEGD